MNEFEKLRSLTRKELAKYISSQLNAIFPDQQKVRSDELLPYIKKAEDRIWHCFASIPKKYFNENGRVHFHHLQADQYCMYLYMLANFIHKHDQHPHLPTKLYCLNKMLHAVDIYFTTELPEVFLFVHPLGTILGRAKFSDYFICYQGCTIGCLNEVIFPELTGKTIMYANSAILGNSRIGDNVCLASGTRIINGNIESNQVVFGQSPELKLTENKKDIFQRPPFYYGS